MTSASGLNVEAWTRSGPNATRTFMSPHPSVQAIAAEAVVLVDEWNVQADEPHWRIEEELGAESGPGVLLGRARVMRERFSSKRAVTGRRAGWTSSLGWSDCPPRWLSPRLARRRCGSGGVCSSAPASGAQAIAIVASTFRTWLLPGAGAPEAIASAARAVIRFVDPARGGLQPTLMARTSAARPSTGTMGSFPGAFTGSLRRWSMMACHSLISRTPLFPARAATLPLSTVPSGGSR